MNTNQPSSWRFRRRAVGRSAAAALAGAMAISASAHGAPNPNTEASVMGWLDDVSPAITVDHTAKCMLGATDAVAYRNDRIVFRTSASNGVIAATVNNALNAMYGPPVTNYVPPGGIERITFPTPPGFGAIVPVVSVTLSPRAGGQLHDVLRLARRIRNDTGRVAAPDYGVANGSHYTYYFPNGDPEQATALTPPRSLQTDAGQPIGDGIKVEIFDTGLAPTLAGELPTTTQLGTVDNELVNRVTNDGDPLLADYKHAGHGKAIAGIITTIAPGATIEVVRVNDRDGLLTDVAAARRIASTLRTLPPASYPDLIVAAYGTAVCDVDHLTGGEQMLPIGSEAVVEVVDKFDVSMPQGMLIVASAGNMGSTREHYPAAFESVLGVGALDGTKGADSSPWSDPSRTAPVASFSNTGEWVDVYATGVDLPTTHVRGVRFETTSPIIDGIATVDGTSFSTPNVVALIAEQMSITGRSARQVRDDLIADGEAPQPECGSQVAPTGTAIVPADLALPITAPATATPITC